MHTVKAIVFDFGNVIINIDPPRTFDAFSKLTFKPASKIKDIFTENAVFQKFEIGHYTEDEFRDTIRQVLAYPLNDHEIDRAWNSLLLDVPQKRIDFIKELRKNYEVYLLSNTNSIHIKKCIQIIKANNGIADFRNLFDHAFMSYEMGLWKPDYKIYHQMLKTIQFKPEEVLFLDDNADNIAAADDLGIKTIKINPPESFTDILRTIL